MILVEVCWMSFSKIPKRSLCKHWIRDGAAQFQPGGSREGLRLKTRAGDASLVGGRGGGRSRGSELVFSTFSMTYFSNISLKKNSTWIRCEMIGTSSVYSIYLILNQNIFPPEKWREGGILSRHSCEQWLKHRIDLKQQSSWHSPL